MQKAKKARQKKVVKNTSFWCPHFKIALTGLVSSFVFPTDNEIENCYILIFPIDIFA